MTQVQLEPTILPALRGVMGNWVYYSCLMTLGELSSRVRFADEVHTHQDFSEMIQRSIDNTRIVEISDYIKEQPQRFFNSLVVAVYEGEPNWHALFNVRTNDSDPILEKLLPETIKSVGFLTLRGDESLFALDGQHRLAGIKAIVGEEYEPAIGDEVSVIFVAHEKSSAGLERTRRLFTTLNKTGRQVTKGDIIALDEDDVMAICVRRLIEQTDLFPGQRILFVQSNNIPSGNYECLTTIGNLYDILTILFTNARFPLRKAKSKLTRSRPDDATLDRYFDYAMEFITLLRTTLPELDEFFTADHAPDIVRKYRGDEEGNALYRPLGLEVFTQIITRVTQSRSIDEAIAFASKLPRNLNEPPYAGLIWEPGDSERSGRIVTRNKVLAREILSYMIGVNGAKYTAAGLLDRYRRETGDANVELPSRLV